MNIWRERPGLIVPSWHRSNKKNLQKSLDTYGTSSPSNHYRGLPVRFALSAYSEHFLLVHPPQSVWELKSCWCFTQKYKTGKYGKSWKPLVTFAISPGAFRFAFRVGACRSLNLKPSWVAFFLKFLKVMVVMLVMPPVPQESLTSSVLTQRAFDLLRRRLEISSAIWTNNYWNLAVLSLFPTQAGCKGNQGNLGHTSWEHLNCPR